MDTTQKFKPDERLIISPMMSIKPEWIDFNGHLNMAYYNVLFDNAYDAVCVVLGLGPEYAVKRQLTTYTGEIHLSYRRELHLQHRVYGTFQLIDFDHKRMHIYQELRHEDGWLSAICEGISLHVDMTGPRVAPYPADILANIKALADRQSALPVPEFVGRKIGIRRKAG